MAITEIWGNRRRTIDRNSKPDICGMFRSEITMAGILLFNCKRASKPCIAILTSYPDDCSTMARLFRMASSSSTTRISCFEDIGMGPDLSCLEIQSFQETHDRIQQLAKLSQRAQLCFTQSEFGMTYLAQILSPQPGLPRRGLCRQPSPSVRF